MFNEFMRSSMTPCGTFLFATAIDTCVNCWNIETGDLVITNNMDLNYLRPPRDINYHPYDHMIAFASYGTHSPIFIFNYDSNVATRNISADKHLNNIQVSTLKPVKPLDEIDYKTKKQSYLAENDTDVEKYSNEQLTQWKRVQTQLDAVCVSFSFKQN